MLRKAPIEPQKDYLPHAVVNIANRIIPPKLPTLSLAIAASIPTRNTILIRYGRQSSL